jgi:DNA invertase Pin-like site-specific DNA recombinase
VSFIRAYLRASTVEQDASRAKADLDRFVAERNQLIAAYYAENESGASLKRPELFRLLSDSHKGDLLLVEQVDRLSRLNSSDWEKLRLEIKARDIRIVAMDLPTSWLFLTTAAKPDDFTSRMFAAINDMLLDMLAAIARKDYEDRRRRQTQGIIKAKDEGLYKGRPENVERNVRIAKLLQAKHSWSSIMDTMQCSRSTIARVAERLSITTVNIKEGFELAAIATITRGKDLSNFDIKVTKNGEANKLTVSDLSALQEGPENQTVSNPPRDIAQVETGKSESNKQP